jgi:hypothetical protein
VKRRTSSLTTSDSETRTAETGTTPAQQQQQRTLAQPIQPIPGAYPQQPRRRHTQYAQPLLPPSPRRWSSPRRAVCGPGLCNSGEPRLHVLPQHPLPNIYASASPSTVSHISLPLFEETDEDEPLCLTTWEMIPRADAVSLALSIPPQQYQAQYGYPAQYPYQYQQQMYPQYQQYYAQAPYAGAWRMPRLHSPLAPMGVVFRWDTGTRTPGAEVHVMRV